MGSGTNCSSSADVVLLFSGGMDSTVLLHLANQAGYTVHALTIDYGQKNRIEIEKAVASCKKTDTRHTIITVPFSHINSGLTGKNELGQYEDVSQWYVPGRNTIFISFALAIAETIGARKIWFGANHDSKANGFPDCTQEYVYAFDGVLKHATTKNISLEAPLLGMGKEMVRKMASSYGIKDSDVHSGYAEK